MPSVVTCGLFLAWIQFLSNKSRQRKEAALTYYPRPMELEEVENEIDKVIKFWSSSYAMAEYEVKLMLDEDITDLEYELCWNRISDQIKRDIIDIYNKYYKLNKISLEIIKPGAEPSLEYRVEYNNLIKEKFVDVRRKFHLYLNQIEGFCLALNKKNIDEKTAKEMYIHKLSNHYRKARPYIDEIRKSKREPGIYIEFERVVKRWEGNK